MDLIQDLRALKRRIRNNQPAHQLLANVKKQLPIPYRTHLMCTWERYVDQRNAHFVTQAIERIIEELQPENQNAQTS